MYGCKSWTIKKAECQKIDAFRLLCWRRLLRVPWTARSQTIQSWRKSNLNIHWKYTGAVAEAPIRWPPDVKNQLMVNDPDAGKDWGQEKREREDDGWMASPTQWTWVWANSRRWWRTVKPGMLQSMGLQSVRHNWATEHHHQPSTNGSAVKTLPANAGEGRFDSWVWKIP